jgi:hypothetical protein
MPFVWALMAALMLLLATHAPAGARTAQGGPVCAQAVAS